MPMMSMPHDAIELRLGQRRELRPFHADVGAAAVHGRADRLAPTSAAIVDRSLQNGCANPTCADEPVAEERADAPLGAIEELIGNDDVERPVLLLQAADRARRQDALDAEHLEAEDVGAEVQLGRQQRWPAPCRARNATRLPRSVPITYGPDGSPNGVATRPLFAVGQLRHVVQAAAADDADRAWSCRARCRILVTACVRRVRSTRLDAPLAVLFADVPGGDRRIVLEEDQRTRARSPRARTPA